MFFDAKWVGDGTVLAYEVAKPSYRPVQPKHVEIAPILQSLMTAAEFETCAPSWPNERPAAQAAGNWFERLFD
ncbi:MAG: hypothetical protein LC648_06570 [Novosphingobium sp.]|nr:hypothetical protein [Novosphingobium sp.]